MENLISRKEAADLLGLAPNTLAKWAMTGKNLSVIRIGSRAVRYSRQEIESFIKGCAAPCSRKESEDIERENDQLGGTDNE